MYRPEKLVLKNFLNHKDTTYSFSHGKAKAIIGVNSFDEGQKSNGSGKSSLLDGISFALVGDTSRSVNNKELIFYDEKEAVSEITLKSEKDVLIIRRTLHKSKSQICEVFFNDNEIKLSDVNEYNKWILEEIGVSRDDLFSFYLLSDNSYKPFLNLSDTLKKQIINRFSGAYLVDAIDPVIINEIEDKKEEVLKLEKEIIKLDSSVEVYKNLIEEIENNGDKTILTEIERYSKQIEQKKAEIETIDTNVIKETEELNKKEIPTENILKAIQKDIVDVENKIDLKKAEIVKISEKETENELLVDSEKNKFEKILTETFTCYKEVSDAIKGFKIEKNNHEVKVLSSIECPKCSHNFVVADDVDVNELKQKIKELEGLIEDNETVLNDLKTIEEETKSERDESIQKIRNSLTEILQDKKQLNIEKEYLEQEKRMLLDKIDQYHNLVRITKQDIEEINSNISKYKVSKKRYLEDIELFENKIKNLSSNDENKKKIEEYKNKIEEIQSDQNKVVADLEKANGELIEKQEQKEIFKSFKTYLANKSLDNMTFIANKYLKDMNSNLSIEINGFKELANKKVKEEISSTIYRNGREIGSYGRFSGGERGRIDIALILTNQTLINNTTKGKGLDLLCCDEILDKMDTIGLENVIHSLDNVNKTVLLVSQNDLNVSEDSTLIIENIGGIASIKEK